MSHSIPFKFKQSSGTSKDGGPTIYKAIASTAALDRDREVLLPKGCVTDEFLKNPVMLHIHDYGNVPVAKVHSINITEDQVDFDFEFYDDEEGKKLEDMYVRGFMNAFSVGFYPLKALWIDEDTPKRMDFDVVDGTHTLNLEDYIETPRRVVNMWELLEISPVPVPSNPEALLLRAKENIVRKFMGAGKHSEAQGQLLEAQLSGKLNDLTANMKSFFKEIDTEHEVRGPVALHSTEVDMDADWDTSGAKGKLSKWASEDNSGLKATVDWGKYVKGFGWVNISKADTFTAYKFAHHTIKEDELVSVWKGVTTAMASLLGDEGKDLSEDDRKEVYDHLAAHYEDAEKEAPALDAEYSDEDLVAVAEDTYTVEQPVSDPEKDATADEGDTADPKALDPSDSTEFKEFFQVTLKSLQDAVNDDIKELEETVRLRLNILLDAVEDVREAVGKIKAEPVQASTDDDDDAKDVDSDEDLTKQLGDLSDLITNQLTSSGRIQ